MKLPIIIFGLCCSFNSFAQEPSELKEGREIVASFAKALKSTLKPVLKQQGPIAAINVCSEAAPRLAEQFSTTTQWRVTRTSLKNRNSNNAPDAWEAKGLKLFEVKKSQGVDVTKLEHWEIVNNNGSKTLRYMKAIPTAAKPCLVCHGTNIRPSIKTRLAENYPLDKATGYQAGDIRGAFSLSKQL